MNRSQSKYFATAAKMDEAFLALLDKKDLPYITVKEICAAAGVNRSTYYLHYETIDDLIKESAQYLTEQFLESMECCPEDIMTHLSTCPVEELYLLTPQYLKPYLRYIQDHRRLFRTAMRNSQVLDLDGTYGRMFRHVFAPILRRFSIAEKDHPYYMAFYVHGLVAIISEWLEGDCSDSIEHIIAVMQECVAPSRAKG